MAGSLIRKLRVAAIQMASTDLAFSDNLETAGQFVRAAAQGGAQVVLLPELFRAGYLLDPQLWRAGELLSDSDSVKFMQRIAVEHQVYVGGTLLEADGEDFFNTFALVGPDGELLGTVRKAVPASFEAFFFRGGGWQPHVINTPLGPIGVAICYETMLAATPRLFTAKHGIVEADLLLCPFSAPTPSESAMFDTAQIEQYLGILKAAAVNMAYILGIPVVMANKVGPWRQKAPLGLDGGTSVFSGCSTIAAAGGALLQQEYDQAGAREVVLIQDVELDPHSKSSACRVRGRCRSSKDGFLFPMPVPWLTWAVESVGQLSYRFSYERRNAALQILAPGSRAKRTASDVLLSRHSLTVLAATGGLLLFYRSRSSSR